MDLAHGLRESIWMGGTLEERGNTTETGEWNACVDPRRPRPAWRPARSSRIFPLDATQDVVFTMEDLDALPETHAGRRSCATRFASTSRFHRQADGIDGCYLHDPVTLIGSLLRPDLVTETVDERLACDTGSDPHLAGSLYRADDDDERPAGRHRHRPRRRGDEGELLGGSRARSRPKSA